MNNIIKKEDSVESYYDFELNIERTHKVEYKYSYPENVKLKGIVFIIAGFGDDTNSEYSQKLRDYIADKFSVAAVSVAYHCFYSRVVNGATLKMDEADTKVFEFHLNELGLKRSKDDSIDDLLKEIDELYRTKKKRGEASENHLALFSMSLQPKYEEYQNFGVLQALDHLNVLKSLEQKSLSFEENYSVTMIGSSHGGYIAYLCAKLAPQKIDTVIDNSSYVLPPYKYIVGKEYDLLNPEYIIDYADNVKIYCFVKSGWTLEKDAHNYFSSDRYRIRNLADERHLKKMQSYSKRGTRYVSYHSATDIIASVKDKDELYKKLSKMGFDAKLHIIKETSDVDGKFVKTLEHGMEMSMKELANRELPAALDVEHDHSSDEDLVISYKCDTLEYTFEIKDGMCIGRESEIVKESEEAELEAKAVDIYTKNLEYLQKNQKIVYDKLASFDLAIEQGHYQNRYDLILKDGYFDVLEFASENYLYSSSSSEYASNASESIDFQNSSNAFETFKKVHIQDELLAKYAEVEVIENNLSALAPLINFIDKNSSESSTLKRVEKFVFFGIGLGTHLMSIDRKISAKVYFIVEDDLELFKLSLFTTPYFELAQNAKLIFSVFTQTKEFSEDAKKFLDCEFWHNHYIKYFQMLSHSEEKLREFHIKVASQTHNLFYYSDILKQYTAPLKYLKSGYNFLNIVRLRSDSYFTSKPTLIIAAGPSLAKEMKWLKKNHKRFIIVALSATLSILEKNSISPDIVTHIDGLSNASAHFEKLESLEFLKDTLFLFSAKTAGDVVEKLSKENLFFFENGTSYKKDFGSITAPCVGSTTFLLMLLFNVRELYLLGLDLALDSKTGATHSDGHEYAKSLDLNSIDEDNISYKKSVMKCAGNFQEEVYTTPEYKFSIDSINSSSINFKNEVQNIYNLSDGARLANATPLKSNKIKTESLTELDKQALRAEIKGLFSTNSSNKMSRDELNYLAKRGEHALKIKEIIRAQEMSSFATSKEFLDSLKKLYEQLAVSSTLIDYDLSLVYENYFKFIYTFIFDFFNRSDLRNVDVNIKEINRILSLQLFRLVNYYERVL